jgi:hypothetical protein
MTIKTAGCDDHSLCRADVRIGPDYEVWVYSIHDPWITSLANTSNQSVLDPYVSLDDAEHWIDDCCVRYYEIECAFCRSDVAMTTGAYSQSLSRSEDEFVAWNQKISLDFCPEICVAETNLISRRWSVQFDILAAGQHFSHIGLP